MTRLLGRLVSAVSGVSAPARRVDYLVFLRYCSIANLMWAATATRVLLEIALSFRRCSLLSQRLVRFMPLYYAQ